MVLCSLSTICKTYKRSGKRAKIQFMLLNTVNILFFVLFVYLFESGMRLAAEVIAQLCSLDSYYIGVIELIARLLFAVSFNNFTCLSMNHKSTI